MSEGSTVAPTEEEAKKAAAAAAVNVEKIKNRIEFETVPY